MNIQREQTLIDKTCEITTKIHLLINLINIFISNINVEKIIKIIIVPNFNIFIII